jgi:uncharacterized protein
MTTTFVESVDPAGFEMWVDETQVGHLLFSIRGDVMDITSTVVYEEFGGKGFGGKLVMHALDVAQSRSYSVIPTCPFVVNVIERKPGTYLDLIRSEDRLRFGLPSSVDAESD